jgi:hypothetical protein
LISETKFQAEIYELAKKFGWLYYHTHRSDKSPSGFPDCIMLRGQRMIVAELKSQEGIVSETQQQWLNAFAAIHGNEVWVWRPDDFSDIVEIMK